MQHTGAVIERALVTGASGFIGTHLVKSLRADGVSVQALVRSGVAPNSDGVVWLKGDIRDAESMARAARGVDTIFHLAARVHQLDEDELGAAEEHREANLEGTRNVLAGAIAAGVRRFVFFSSVKAMGEHTIGQADECATAAPVSAYGRSKLAAEDLVKAAAGTRLHTVCLRLPMVWGAGGAGNLARMLAAIESGRFPPVPAVENRRSLVHVQDVVSAAKLAATSPIANGKTYIVTDGVSYSTREMYLLMCRALGKRIPRWQTPLWMLKGVGAAGTLLGHMRGRRWIFDSQSLQKLTGTAWYSSAALSRDVGYRPSVTLEQGLPEYVSWYRAQCAILASAQHSVV